MLLCGSFFTANLHIYADNKVNDSITPPQEYITIGDLTQQFTELKSTFNNTERKNKAAILLNDFSVFLIENGEWFLAGPLIENALYYCASDSIELKNHLIATSASFQYLNGDLEEAEKTFKRLYEETDRDSTQIDAHIRLGINLGEICQQSGRKKQALEYFEKAESLADSIGSKYLYANAIIHAERLEDNSHIQLDILQKCIEAVFEGNCNTLMAPAYLAMARYHFRQGDYQEAIKEIDKACAIAKKLGQLKYETEGLQLWGNIYSRQNNPAMSYACMQRLVELREAANKERDRLAADHAMEADKILQWCREELGTPSSAAGKSDRQSYFGVLVVVVLLVLVICILVFTIILKKKRAEYRDMVENLKEEISGLRGESIKLEILYKGFGSMLTRIRQSLKNIKTDDSQLQAKIKDVSASILQNALPERRNAFNIIAEEEDERFITKLEGSIGSELNPADRKLAIYLCHGLTTQEISCITGVLPKSVNQNRYRLRRVLGLEQEDNLEEVLLTHYKEANLQIDNKVFEK